MSTYDFNDWIDVCFDWADYLSHVRCYYKRVCPVKGISFTTSEYVSIVRALLSNLDFVVARPLLRQFEYIDSISYGL